MPTPDQQNNTTRSYTVLELSSPMTITLTDGSVFIADRYQLSTKLVTAFGSWMGGNNKHRALIIPTTAILSMDITAKEIPEASVPAEHQESVKNQVKGLGLSPAEG